MLKPSILNALRKATALSIRIDPTVIQFIPHNKIRKPGGGYDTPVGTPLDPQTFLVEPISSTLSGITGAGGGFVATDGAKAHQWSYQITGLHNSNMEIGYTWKEGNTTYRIDAIQPANGYERVGICTAIGGDPSYGS